jgi:hypothetical protein
MGSAYTDSTNVGLKIFDKNLVLTYRFFLLFLEQYSIITTNIY